jgi:hypothetical protein
MKKITWRVRWHPDRYAVAETERLYADMAAKGWPLSYRVGHFSVFKKAPPERAVYRIVLADPNEEEPTGPEFDGLWRLAARQREVLVYRAPEGTAGAPPMDSAKAAGSMRRSFYASAAMGLCVLILYVLIITINARANGAQNWIEAFWDSLRVKFVLETGRYGIIYTYLLYLCYYAGWAGYHERVLYRRCRKGEPINRPIIGYGFHRALTRACAGLCAVFLIFTVVQWAGARDSEMPPESDGPYLTLSELGWTGVRAVSGIQTASSSVRTSESLLARRWHTYECVAAGDDVCYLYQDVFELKNPGDAAAVVRWQMANSTFADGQAYTRREIRA